MSIIVLNALNETFFSVLRSLIMDNSFPLKIRSKWIFLLGIKNQRLPDIELEQQIEFFSEKIFLMLNTV